MVSFRNNVGLRVGVQSDAVDDLSRTFCNEDSEPGFE